MRGFTFGFTLLELLVVISIMAVLTIIAVPSFNEYSRNQKLNDAASQLQSILRQTQNNAQTGTVCNTLGEAHRATYWRVNLSKVPPVNKYYSMDPICEIGAIASQQINLPEGVIISDLILDTCSPDEIQVQFSNINSEISFFDPSFSPLVAGCPDLTNYSLEITLSLPGSQSKIVKIEKGGGIYVKQ